jgi:tetratricopeptide (TPR) repeat protein
MPQSPEAHNNLGIALGSQGRIDEAVAEFEAALRIKPDFVDARRNLDMVRRTTSNRRGR